MPTLTEALLIALVALAGGFLARALLIAMTRTQDIDLHGFAMPVG